MKYAFNSGNGDQMKDVALLSPTTPVIKMSLEDVNDDGFEDLIVIEEAGILYFCFGGYANATLRDIEFNACQTGFTATSSVPSLLQENYDVAITNVGVRN